MNNHVCNRYSTTTVLGSFLTRGELFRLHDTYARLEIAREIKEATCCVSKNYQRDIEQWNESKNGSFLICLFFIRPINTQLANNSQFRTRCLMDK